MLKKHLTLVWIVIGIILLSVIGTLVYFNYLTTHQSIVSSESSEKLPCSSEQACMSYLISQGMPQDFLSKNSISIVCTNGACYAQK